MGLLIGPLVAVVGLVAAFYVLRARARERKSLYSTVLADRQERIRAQRTRVLGEQPVAATSRAQPTLASASAVAERPPVTTSPPAAQPPAPPLPAEPAAGPGWRLPAGIPGAGREPLMPEPLLEAGPKPEVVAPEGPELSAGAQEPAAAALEPAVAPAAEEDVEPVRTQEPAAAEPAPPEGERGPLEPAALEEPSPVEPLPLPIPSTWDEKGELPAEPAAAELPEWLVDAPPDSQPARQGPRRVAWDVIPQNKPSADISRPVATLPMPERMAAAVAARPARMAWEEVDDPTRFARALLSYVSLAAAMVLVLIGVVLMAGARA